MRKLALILILLCAPAMWGACAATGSGTLNWSSNATWTGCIGAIPGASDAVTIGNTRQVICDQANCDVLTLTTAGNGSLTIASGNTYTEHCTVAPCETLAGTGGIEFQSGSTASIGFAESVSNTVDVTVGTGTHFLVDNGATVTHHGSIFWSVAGSTASAFTIAGRLICAPSAVTVQQQIKITASSMGNNSAVLTLGVANGSDWSKYGVYETATAQNAGKSCQIFQNGGQFPKLVANYFIFNNAGDSTVLALSATAPCTSGCSGGDINFQNVLVENSGELSINTNNGIGTMASNTFQMANVDCRGVLNTNGYCLYLNSSTSAQPATTRNVTGITCDNESTSLTGNLSCLALPGAYFNVGASIRSGQGVDTPGFYAYNAGTISISTSRHNMLTGVFEVENFTSQPNYNTFIPMSDSTIQDSAFFLNNPNGHNLIATGSTAGGGANYYQYLFTDGGFYINSGINDSGELCHGNYTVYCQHNILVNSNQNVVDTTSVNDSDHVLNNTLYNQVGMALGENSGSATEVYEVYDNLQMFPPATFGWTSSCAAYYGFWSAVANGSPNWFLSQTYGYEDNNGYYGFANSSDPGSGTCTVQTGGQGVVYKGIFAIGFQPRDKAVNTDKAMTLSGTTLTCATCNFTSGGDETVLVNDAVFNTTTKTAWTNVAPGSITATSLVLASTSGFTSGDHITVMKGPWANGNAIGSATNYGAHDIHANANFFNPGDAVCPWYNRTAGTALTCLTSPSGTSNAATAIAIGHAIVTLNGWDYGSGASLAGTNCAANCPQRVTPLDSSLYVSNLLKAMAQSYRVYNGMYVNAGHTGGDVGAAWLPNYPAAILSSN